MGRPLNKKYFGNFNIGTGGYTPVPGGNTGGDDGIGGEGVATYGSITTGTGWTSTPTVTFSAPDIPGGVTTTGTVHYSALSATVNQSGTKAYQPGQILATSNGASFEVITLNASLSDSIASVNGSNQVVFSGTTAYIPGMDFLTNAGITFSAGGLAPATRYWIVAGSGTTYTIASSYANAINGTALTLTAGTCTANGGVLVGTTAGPVATVVMHTGGDFTSFTTGGKATTNQTTPGGTGVTLNVTCGLLSIAVTQKGSGYTTPADAAVSFSGSTGAAATAVLTTDSGSREAGTNHNVATNQDNAIIIHANTGAGTQIGDIREQVGSRRYRVKTAGGVAVCKLVPTFGLGLNEAYIKATDYNGNTYFVKKLTAHRVTLIQWTNNESTWLYDNNTVAGWTFGSPVAPGDSNHLQGLVTIENA